MRECLSGRALPCQGRCRGSESRLPLQFWYHRQVVRQRSAKPLFPSSNLGGTSKVRKGYMPFGYYTKDYIFTTLCRSGGISPCRLNKHFSEM